MEANLILKNGEKMMIRSSGAPLILDGQKYFVGIGVDITERKHLEEKLNLNLKDLLESQRIAKLGTWRLNLATNQVVWSEELYKMYGFDPTIPPPNYTEHMKLFTPESWDKLSTSLERTRTVGTPYELELETVKADGLNGWMWVRGEAEKDSKGNIISLWGAARDITELKKIEYELRQSEEKFQLLFEQAPLGYQSLDFEGNFIEVNQKWLDTLGYSKEEVIGKWFGDFLCPEYVEGFRQRFTLFKAKGHIHSEFEMLTKDGQRLFMAFEGKVGNNKEGKFKQTHCILKDITDQKKAEKALIESEERYKCLFEHSGVGIGYYTTDGIVISYNQKALENIGGKLEDYIGKSIKVLFPKEEADIYFARIEKAILSDKPQEYEDYSVLGSKPKWFSRTFTRVVDITGEVVGVQIASLDITERKLAETASIENSFRFHSLFNEMSAGAAIYKVLNDGQYGKDYIIQDFNKAAIKAEGKEKTEVLGRSLYDLRPNIDQYGLITVFQRVWKTGEAEYYPSKIYIDEKFSNWYENRVYKLPSGEIVAIFDDVTEKTLAEEALRKSEQKYINYIQNAPDGIFIADETGQYLEVNIAASKITGYTKNEILHMKIGDILAPETMKDGMKHFKSLLETGKSSGSTQYKHKDGSTRWWTVDAVKLTDHHFLGFVKDITESKKAEEALIHSHDLMRYIIEHNRGAVAVHDRDLKYLYVSNRYIGDYNIKEKNIIGKHHYDVLPVIPQKWRDVHQKALQGEISSSEKDYYVLEDGSVAWTRWECRPWYEPDGSIGGIIIYTEIITEHVRLLAELENKEQNLRIAQEIAHVGSFDYDINRHKLTCSDVGLNICGITQKEFSGKKDAIIQFIHPDEKEYVLEISSKAITEKKVMNSELRIIRQDGEERIVDFRVGPVFDENGNCVRTTGTIQDITERKKAEKNLIYLNNHDFLTDLYNRRYFEEEIKRLDAEENLPLSIIMADTNGLKIINDSFGHDTGDELLKKASYAIKQVCRAEDIVVRYGGDEFVIILPNTNNDEALKIASSIKELASREKVANIELSISYGYATKHSTHESIMEILANAENHMYSHKLSERSSMRSKITEIIMNTLFEKSHKESQHSMRVSKLCEAIAIKMEFEKQEVDKMRIAGLVHDIGKIGVDEKILNKNGKLDRDEMKEIERHAESGWRILSSSIEFAELAKYILHHHERWDGNGYPNKLAGENIAIQSRIITVADAYDAMISDRSYRKLLSKEEAIKELKRCSGTQFDPNIVDIFVNQVLSNL